MIFLEMLKASLQNPAAVGMCREFIHVSLERADKSQPFRSHAFNELLNDLDGEVSTPALVY